MATEAKIETTSDSESESDEELKVTKQKASQGQWYELENFNFSKVTDVCLSFDGKLIAACGLVANPKNQICVWDLEEGSQGHMRLTIPGKLLMTKVWFSPDNKKLACSNGGEIWVFSLADAKEIRCIDPFESDDEDEIANVFFSLDGALLLVAYESDYFDVWDIDSGQFLGNQLFTSAGSFKEKFVCAGSYDRSFPLALEYAIVHLKLPRCVAWGVLECMPPIISVQFDDPEPIKSSYAKIPAKAPRVDN